MIEDWTPVEPPVGTVEQWLRHQHMQQHSREEAPQVPPQGEGSERGWEEVEEH